MKKMIVLTSALLFGALFANADGLTGKKIAFSSLPGNAQSLISNNFKVSSIKQVKATKNTYQVEFSNGDEVDFYKSNGEWRSVECSKGIPSGIVATLPAEIRKYVKANYPKFPIVEVDRKDGYELKLSNGIELDFMPDGKFIKMKKY